MKIDDLLAKIKQWSYEHERLCNDLERQLLVLQEGLTGEEVDNLPSGSQATMLLMSVMRVSARAATYREIAAYIEKY